MNEGLGTLDAQHKMEEKLEGDHVGICKFGKNDKIHVGLVSEGIRYLLEKSPKAKGL